MKKTCVANSTTSPGVYFIVYGQKEQHRILSLDRECELLPIVARKVQTLVNPRLPEIAVDGVALKEKE